MERESFINRLKAFFRLHLFNPKWRCLSCGKEIFNEKYFCNECEEELPYVDKYYCEHCGRKLLAPSNYCSSCKGKSIYVDKARSLFNYEKPIDGFIQQLKYYDKRFVADIFGEKLANLYRKNYFNADCLCFIPMTKKSKRKRGYNQSELIANSLSKQISVPVKELVTKEKETVRQAKLSREERLKNLKGCFKPKSKKEIDGKTIVLIDDVLTTGATSEAVAEVLKKKGAKAVYLLTVASVTSKEGY
jgi:ComF family protein